MGDLATWLQEQIRADRGIARGALWPLGADDGRWRSDGQAIVNDSIQGAVAEGNPGSVKHIANWDPHRVLRDCEARQQIVKIHERNDRDMCMACEDPRPVACETLRLIALPFADREGYQEQWRP
jgi:Family of unknown function (DUF6221)